jgi:hypothetical protein
MLLTVVGALLLAAPLACGGSEPGVDAGTGTGSGEQGLDALALVERFMQARQEGLPADEFMAPEVQTAYARHEGGLWLHDDTLPGGPGAEFEEFAATVSPGADAWMVEVRTRLAWAGDARPSEMVELLTVGSDTVLEARRTDASDGGLPLAVAEKRQAIYGAAVKQHSEALASLLDPDTFSYSFGESGDPIGYWRRQEESEIPILGDILPGVLGTRFGLNEDIYVWPSAAAKEAPEWTRADVKSMRNAGYTDDDISSFRQFGGYTGWRAGIRADGTWLYFISGD